MVNTLFYSLLQLNGLLTLALCFNTMVHKMIAILFDLLMDKTETPHDEQIFLEIKF